MKQLHGQVNFISGKRKKQIQIPALCWTTPVQCEQDQIKKSGFLCFSYLKSLRNFIHKKQSTKGLHSHHTSFIVFVVLKE